MPSGKSVSFRVWAGGFVMRERTPTTQKSARRSDTVRATRRRRPRCRRCCGCSSWLAADLGQSAGRKRTQPGAQTKRRIDARSVSVLLDGQDSPTLVSFVSQCALRETPRRGRPARLTRGEPARSSSPFRVSAARITIKFFGGKHTHQTRQRIGRLVGRRLPGRATGGRTPSGGFEDCTNAHSQSL